MKVRVFINYTVKKEGEFDENGLTKEEKKTGLEDIEIKFVDPAHCNLFLNVF